MRRASLLYRNVISKRSFQVDYVWADYMGVSPREAMSKSKTVDADSSARFKAMAHDYHALLVEKSNIWVAESEE